MLKYKIKLISNVVRKGMESTAKFEEKFLGDKKQ